MRLIICLLLLAFLVFTVTACTGGGPKTIRYTLTMEMEGSGTVLPAAGTHTFVLNTEVTVEAVPDADWVFSHWVGEVAEPKQGKTIVLIDDDKTVRAVFDDPTLYHAGGIPFYMSLAPAATLPTGENDSGEATVYEDFWMAETPVTYELWYAVQQWGLLNGYAWANPGREGSHGSTGELPTLQGNEPVTEINWRDSVVWTNALSEMLAYDPVYTHDGQVIRDATQAAACDNAVHEYTDGFRLPTSNEWELAARYKGDDSSYGAIARGGLYWTPGSYASGAVADHSDAAATQAVAWYGVDSTKQVGLKQANGLGLFDMSGNVWEWTSTKDGLSRVVRGGSWELVHSFALQLGRPSRGNPGNTYEGVGFRFVRTAR